jgi:hypothetical protein
MAADSRSPRDGKHLEVLGYYNPLPGFLSRTFVPIPKLFAFVFESASFFQYLFCSCLESHLAFAAFGCWETLGKVKELKCERSMDIGLRDFEFSVFGN